MDKIHQYYKITNVKPEYHVLYSPYFNPSKKRIIFNGKELELYYSNEFHTYIEGNLADLQIKEGGAEQKILILEL